MLNSAHPILPAQDMDATEAFYRALGFVSQGRWGGYMILRRDGVELHFWHCTDPKVAETSSCYIRVSDVDALHKSLSPIPGGKLLPPEDRPWGMREFFVLDINGNLLRFGQLIVA
jgi:catechol 2,3-dioxygenase-like lactoylglutathione lyase family enzyme